MATPERFTSAILDITNSYSKNLIDLGNRAIFKENSQFIMVKDIKIYSLCEHHMLLFIRKIEHG